MPKDTKTLGNNKARACESLGFVHKKRLCQRFDTTSPSLLVASALLTDGEAIFSVRYLIIIVIEAECEAYSGA